MTTIMLEKILIGYGFGFLICWKSCIMLGNKCSKNIDIKHALKEKESGPIWLYISYVFLKKKNSITLYKNVQRTKGEFYLSYHIGQACTNQDNGIHVNKSSNIDFNFIKC